MPQDHYFAESPAAASHPKAITVRLAGREVELETDAGIFSQDRLDPGTEVLLHEAPVPDHGRVLDLGCGYGPVAISLALRAPHLLIDAVDINARAAEMTRRNTQKLRLANITVLESAGGDSEIMYDAIYCNPPIRSGKDALHQLLTTWLARLTQGGAAYLVVNRHLGADSLASWLEGRDFVVSRIASKRGYRVLEVKREA